MSITLSIVVENRLKIFFWRMYIHTVNVNVLLYIDILGFLMRRYYWDGRWLCEIEGRRSLYNDTLVQTYWLSHRYIDAKMR